MSDVPKWARETVERFLEDRDWLEDCTCGASIPEQTCWYHLAPEEKRRYREEALRSEVLAAYERGKMERWAMLRRTSNSGKALYLCRSCENVTPSPTIECGPFVSGEGQRDCGKWERRALAARGPGGGDG